MEDQAQARAHRIGQTRQVGVMGRQHQLTHRRHIPIEELHMTDHSIIKAHGLLVLLHMIPLVICHRVIACLDLPFPPLTLRSQCPSMHACASALQVLVLRLLTSGSIEEHMYRVSDEKRRFANSSITGE